MATKDDIGTEFIVIRALKEGEPPVYASTNGWTEHPGRAMYYSTNSNVKDLVKTVISCYGRATGITSDTKIEPVVVCLGMKPFDTSDPHWINAVREHAIMKLTPIEVDALDVGQHALFVKLAQETKTTRRRKK